MTKAKSKDSSLDQRLNEILDEVHDFAINSVADPGGFNEVIEWAEKVIRETINSEKFKYATDILSDMFTATAISEDDYDNWTKQLTEEFDASLKALYNTKEKTK